MPKCLEHKYGTHYVIENLEFPHGQNLLEEAILKPISTEHGKDKFRPVSYRFVERFDKKKESSFYCQAMFETKSKDILSDKRLGAIGLDLNKDHIALCETDRFGNPIFAQSYAFDFENKSSEQIKAILADHIAVIVDRAVKSGKIIACEKLDFEKKKEALRETTPKGLRTVISYFAYKKFYELLKSRCKREGIYLKAVNPAFTSLIGFYKYFGYGIYTSHECAALSIVRRALTFSERAKRVHGTLMQTVSIAGDDELPEFSHENSFRHVWSFYSRNKSSLRLGIINSSKKGSEFKVSYSPLHPSGYKASGLGCDKVLLRSLSP